MRGQTSGLIPAGGSRGPSSADLFALGVVAATAALVLFNLRYVGEWPAGALLAVSGAAAAVVYALGARGGRPTEPRPDRSALLLSALVLTAFALAHLTEVLGEGDALGGTSVVWASGAFAAVAAITGVIFRSAACTFLAAAAAGALTIGLIATVIEPDDEEAYQWGAAAYFVVACTAGYLLRALGERRHSTQLVTAAAFALIAVGYGFGFFFAFDFEGEDYYSSGGGLELLMVGGALLVLAYGLLFRERGPGWAGAVALGVGLLTVDQGATLVVWPLALMGAAALLMVAAAVRSRAE